MNTPGDFLEHQANLDALNSIGMHFAKCFSRLIAESDDVDDLINGFISGRHALRLTTHGLELLTSPDE